MTATLPNVVLVVLDTARRDRFGCYGYDRPTTPTVDSLAKSGVQADTMLASAPWTMPSHASLFTGLYPSQHGSQWQTGPKMRTSVPITLAEWMRSIGYETVCATNNGLISPKTGLARGFDRYAFRLDIEQGQKRIRRRLKKVLFGGDSGGLVINDWLRRELPNVRRPLFLFVNYLECHWAYVPPARLEKRVGGPRFGFVEAARYRAGLARTAGPWEAIARADARTLDVYSTLYDGELANADEHVDELLDILRASGHLPEGETLVIVTSDHGEHIGDYGLADHHASLADTLIRVPFIAWAPGWLKARRVTDLFEFVDVFPSIAHLLGRDVPSRVTGRRADLFVPGAGEHRPYGFAEWRSWSDKERRRLAQRNPSYDFSGLGLDLVCVRYDNLKLVRRGDGREALYDCNQDESTDVSAQHPGRLAEMRALLDREVASWSQWGQGDEALRDDERAEIEERLSALGYI